MVSAQKFTFGQDFREGAPKRFSESEVAHAEAAAYERGFADGRLAQDLALQERMTTALERLATLAQGLLADAAASRAAAEMAAVEFALAFARQIGGAAIARAPVAPIADAARGCFEHLAGVPHLAARVNQALVEDTQKVLGRLAQERGFEGKMIVIGEPDIPPGDVRLEWAEGAMIRDRAAIDDRIQRAVSAWAADPATRR